MKHVLILFVFLFVLGAPDTQAQMNCPCCTLEEWYMPSCPGFLGAHWPPPGPQIPTHPTYPSIGPSPPGVNCRWEFNYDYVGDGSGPILARICCSTGCGPWGAI